MRIATHEIGGAVLGLQANACKWPIGEPREPDFKFCCKAAVAREVYCEEHCWRAYPQTGHRLPGKVPREQRAVG